jgi:hypothetical protein
MQHAKDPIVARRDQVTLNQIHHALEDLRSCLVFERRISDREGDPVAGAFEDAYYGVDSIRYVLGYRPAPPTSRPEPAGSKGALNAHGFSSGG